MLFRSNSRIGTDAVQPDFSANQGFDTAFARLSIKLDGTKQIAQIGDSQRALPIGSSAIDDIIDAIGTINNRKLGV